jgi:hypothetical protein
MNTKTTPKDIFMHLGATVALYVSVGALINLAFSVINYYFPDALANYFYSGSIAWPISILVVLVPILIVLEWLIVREGRNMPEKNELYIRKFRIYLTLFIAGAFMAGDIVALINQYLSGEIGTRFVFKVVALFVVFGIIFAYYLLDKIGGSAKTKVAKKVLATLFAVIVILAIVSGFLVVGSPATQRALRFDNERVANLSSIQWSVLNSWQQRRSLPNSLSEIDSASGIIVDVYKIPTDPETKVPYTYTKTSSTTFELCADFSRASRDNFGRGGYASDATYPSAAYDYGYDGVSQDWKHEAGKVCFTRKVDMSKLPAESVKR